MVVIFLTSNCEEHLFNDTQNTRSILIDSYISSINLKYNYVPNRNGKKQKQENHLFLIKSKAEKTKLHLAFN